MQGLCKQGATKGMVIGFMNFSVITRNPSGYKAGKMDFDKYKEAILNPERLKVRESIFFNYTVPTLINQSISYATKGIVLRFNVAVSDQLPDDLLSKFIELTKIQASLFNVFFINESYLHNWSETLTSEVSVLNCLESEAKDAVAVFNFRLDDDDVLSDCYFQLLENYLKPEYEGFYLTFPNGFIGVHDGSYERFYALNRPFLAIGLGKLSRYSISECRITTSDPSIMSKSHTKIALNCKSIHDATKPGYIWTMHRFSDTRSVDQSEKQSRHKIEQFIADNKLTEVPWDEVCMNFSQVGMALSNSSKRF